jgi:hypothetical protein
MELRRATEHYLEVRDSWKSHFSHLRVRMFTCDPKVGSGWVEVTRKASSPQRGQASPGQRASRFSSSATRFSRLSKFSGVDWIFFHVGHFSRIVRRSLRLNMSASIVKTKLVSVGLLVCRGRSGEIIFSAHQREQRILLGTSDAECASFIEQLEVLLRGNPNPAVSGE